MAEFLFLTIMGTWSLLTVWCFIISGYRVIKWLSKKTKPNLTLIRGEKKEKNNR